MFGCKGLGSSADLSHCCCHQLLIVLFGDRLRFCQERRTRKRGPKCNLHILLSPEQTKHTIECFCIGSSSRALLPLKKKRTKNWKRLCSLVHDFQLNPSLLVKKPVAFLGQSNKESQTFFCSSGKSKVLGNKRISHCTSFQVVFDDGKKRSETKLAEEDLCV